MEDAIKFCTWLNTNLNHTNETEFVEGDDAMHKKDEAKFIFENIGKKMKICLRTCYQEMQMKTIN